jgi:hypothetical protein
MKLRSGLGPRERDEVRKLIAVFSRKRTEGGRSCEFTAVERQVERDGEWVIE